jgi:hypothetical protein
MNTNPDASWCLTAAFILSIAGCVADEPLNPSFPLRLEEAKVALEEMAAAPVELKRPVIVVGGYLDPGFATPRVRETVRRIGGGDRVISVHFLFQGDFDGCRDHLLSSIEEAFPSGDPNWTMEVDIIGGSMGGIVSRYAAMPLTEEEAAARPVRKRLRIARLFTTSTPHLGAKMADIPTLDPLAINMRCGSAFLARLDAELPHAAYQLIPYVRLGDMVVGPENAAPAGRTAWWVANQPLQFAHLACMRDQRFLADISRRLRGETPYTSEPPAALP